MTLVEHPAGLETPRHDHPHACLHVVLRGLYVEHTLEGTTVACPGEVVYKAPGTEHWNRFGTTGAESLRCELAGDSIEAELGFDPREAQGWAQALRIGRTLHTGLPVRTRGAGAPQLRLLQHLRRHFRTPRPIAELALQLGVHRSHLTRQFTSEFGCSPQSFLAWKRSAWLAEKLMLGGRSLVDLALEAGFSDQSHATRTFKRVFGSSPRRWCRTPGR